MRERASSARSDRAGIIISSVCLVHCVAGPALLAFAGLASLIRISEKFESVFVLGSAVMGATALVTAYRGRHRRRSCLAIFGAGLLVLLVRRHIGEVAGIVESVITLVGASMMITAHILNIRYSRTCACCQDRVQPAGSENI